MFEEHICIDRQNLYKGRDSAQYSTFQLHQTFLYYQNTLSVW